MHNFGGLGSLVEGLKSGRGADLTGAKNCKEAIAKSCGKIEPLLIYLKTDLVRKVTDHERIFLIRWHLLQNLLDEKIVDSCDDAIKVHRDQVAWNSFHWLHIVLKPATQFLRLLGLSQTTADVICGANVNECSKMPEITHQSSNLHFSNCCTTDVPSRYWD